jgi:cysteine desulfurase/selenocysteine lyase
MKHMGVQATARASLYVYNDNDDVDALAAALVRARDFFAL